MLIVGEEVVTAKLLVENVIFSFEKMSSLVPFKVGSKSGKGVVDLRVKKFTALVFSSLTTVDSGCGDIVVSAGIWKGENVE